MPSHFAPTFLWGAATSAMQVEGHLHHTNWRDAQRYWRIEQPCGRACDFLNQYEADLDLLKAMGLNAFRFSLEWGRIEPEPGKFDPEAIAHYQRLVKACRARGIEPVLTLWHFAYPSWVERDLRGGWSNPDIVHVFGRYARTMSEALPDVKWWITQNEPNAFAMNTYLLGVFPPGPLPFAKVFVYQAVVNNLVLAHQAAYQEIKRGNPDRMVSANVFHWQPRLGGWPNTPDFVARLEALDYVSFDYYFAHLPWEWPALAFQWSWPVHPEGIADSVLTYWKRFKLPILIAENGLCQLGDRPRADGWTRDRYLVHHLHHLERAADAGAEVVGYMHWSLLDNWEMGSFEPRFGLYQVDFRHPELPRIPTPAVPVYTEIAHERSVPEGLLGRYGVRH